MSNTIDNVIATVTSKTDNKPDVIKDLNISKEDIEELVKENQLQQDNIVVAAIPPNEEYKKDLLKSYNTIETIIITTGILFVICILLLMCKTIFAKQIRNIFRKLKHFFKPFQPPAFPDDDDTIKHI